MTEARKKANPKVLEEFELPRVPCIHYLIQFSKFSVVALINSASKVNAMQPSFAKELGPRICKTDVGIQKMRLLYPFPQNIPTSHMFSLPNWQ